MTPDQFREMCQAVDQAPESGLRSVLNSLAAAHQQAMARFAVEAGGAAAVFDVWKSSFTKVCRNTSASEHPHRGAAKTKAWILALAEDWDEVRSGLPDESPLKHEVVFDYVFLRDAPELKEILQRSIPPEEAWHAEVRPWVLRALADPGNPDNPSTSYCDLLSLVDLLNAVVGPPAATSPVVQGARVMESQLNEFSRAERCWTNKLLRVSDVDARAPATASETVTLDVFRLLAHLRWVVRNEQRDLSGLLVSPVEMEVDSTRANLLKHWAATIPLFEVFMAETAGFRFDAGPSTWQTADYHPMSGGDVPVSLIGARDAGKSSFLFAEEAHDVVQLSAIDRVGIDNLTELKRIWMQGGPGTAEERTVWKTGGDTSLTAWSRTDGEMFKLFIRDLPGEGLTNLVLEPDSANSTAMKDHLSRNPPAATLFIFGRPALQPVGEGTEVRAGHVLGSYWRLLPEPRDNVPLLILRNFLDNRIRELTENRGEQEQVEKLVAMTQQVDLEVGGWWADPVARLRRRSHFAVPAFRQMLHEDLAEVDQLRKDAALTEKLPFGFFYVCASGEVVGDYRVSCRVLWQELTRALRRLSMEGRRRLLSQDIKRLERIADGLDAPLKAFDVDPAKAILADRCAAAAIDDDGLLADADKERMLVWQSDQDKVSSLAGIRSIERAADDLKQRLSNLETYLGQLATEVLWVMGIPSDLTLVRHIVPQSLAGMSGPWVDRLASARGRIVVDRSFGVLSTRCPAKDEVVPKDLLLQLFDVANGAPVREILEGMMRKMAPRGADGEYGADLDGWPQDSASEPLTALRLLQGFRYSLLQRDTNGDYDATNPFAAGLGLAARIDLRHFYFCRSQIPTPAVRAVAGAIGHIRECEFRGALLVLSALGLLQAIPAYRQRVDSLRSRLVGDYLVRLIKAYAPAKESLTEVSEKNRAFTAAALDLGFFESMKSQKSDREVRLKAYLDIGRGVEYVGHEVERRNEARAFNLFYSAAMQQGKVKSYSASAGDLDLFPPIGGHLEKCWADFRRATAIAVTEMSRSYFGDASGWLNLQERRDNAQTVDPVTHLKDLTSQIAAARERIEDVAPRRAANSM